MNDVIMTFLQQNVHCHGDMMRHGGIGGPYCTVRVAKSRKQKGHNGTPRWLLFLDSGMHANLDNATSNPILAIETNC